MCTHNIYIYIYGTSGFSRPARTHLAAISLKLMSSGCIPSRWSNPASTTSVKIVITRKKNKLKSSNISCHTCKGRLCARCHSVRTKHREYDGLRPGLMIFTSQQKREQMNQGMRNHWKQLIFGDVQSTTKHIHKSIKACEIVENNVFLMMFNLQQNACSATNASKHAKSLKTINFWWCSIHNKTCAQM